jgi:hypothetical protein
MFVSPSPELLVRDEEREKRALALAIDVGSTKIGLAVYNMRTLSEVGLGDGERIDKFWCWYDQDIHLTHAARRDPVSGEKLTTEKVPLQWKTADGDELFAKISEQASFLLSETDISLEDLNAIVLTGFTNSLAVCYNGRTLVILDEPSLQTELSDQERAIVAQAHGVFGESASSYEIKAQSSLMKLLALRAHPEIVEAMFGDGVTFSDLSFNTMLGLVAGAFREGGFSEIPFPDMRAFTGNNHVDSEVTCRMLAFLGFSSEQISFMPDFQHLVLAEHPPYFFVNDFGAEKQHLTRLWEHGILLENDVIISTDSVGKIISAAPHLEHFVDPALAASWTGFEAIGSRQYFYTTQRVVGNVYGAWMQGRLTRGLWAEEEDRGHLFYDNVNLVIGEGIDEEDSPYFFNPDGVDSGAGEIGALFKKSGEQISLDEALDLPASERKKIIRAIARGVYFGMRSKIEDAEINGSGRIFCYGGMTLNSFWRETIVQCFGGRHVFKINMASGMAAAIDFASTLFDVLDREQILPEIEEIKINGDPDRQSPILDRTDEYVCWREFFER